MSEMTLFYAHDPMCSWCYGFRPVWQKVQQWCEGKLAIEYLLGGLAPDSNELMTESLQADIQSYWRQIQQEIPGIQFNFDFWTNNQPRRSTYRACRAVIATRLQQPEKEYEMITAIQNAYYQQAQNPSDRDVLINCAKAVGLDEIRFAHAIDHSNTQQLLRYEMLQCHELGMHSFPSLLLAKRGEFFDINIDYNNVDAIIEQLKELLD